MKHTKLQRLTFFQFLNERIENEFLEKQVKKLKNNVSLPQRRYITDLVEQADTDANENELKTICLIYSLHTDKPKNGFVDMVIKDMISQTDVTMDEDTVAEIHKKMNSILDALNLPKLSLDRIVARNIAHYSDEFKKQFGRFIEG